MQMVHDDDGVSFDLDYTVRPTQVVHGSYGLVVKTACQVGKDRLVDIGVPSDALLAGRTLVVQTLAWMPRELPGEPSFCDLDFVDYGGLDARNSLARGCWRPVIGVTMSACGANSISGPAATGPTGIVAAIDRVRYDQYGYLLIAYRVTAHRDMPADAIFARSTSCPGRADDFGWYPRLSWLRAGETLLFEDGLGGKRGYVVPGTSCEITLGYATTIDGPITPVLTACHANSTITPGACRR